MKAFFHNNKKWLMYGTLFSALTFSISGTNPANIGYVTLSSEAPTKVETAAKDEKAATPAAASAEASKKSPLKKVLVAKPEAAKADEASKPVAAEKEKPAAEPEVKKASLESEPEIKAKTEPKVKDGTFEGSKTINGKEYEFTFIRQGNQTKVIWAETEATECTSGTCQREAGARILKGDITNNFASMVSHIEKNYITAKTVDAKKSKDKDSEKSDEEAVEKTKGERLLESIVTACDKLKSESSQTECKVEKFLSYLNKKYDKDKKKLDITSEEALDFFNENIKSSLQSMLTHKFAVPRYAGNSVYNSIGFNLESSIELREEQTEAQKQQKLAVKLIKNLIKNIGGKYNDVRKSAESLYEDSMKEQSKNAVSEYLNYKLFKSRNDSAGAYSSAASYTLNDQLLRSLDSNLYGGILSGLNDSRSLLGGTLYNDLANDLRGDQASVCVNYLMLTEQQSNITNAATACGTSASSIQNNIIGIDRNGILGFNVGISNADRLGRGNSNQLNSGTAGSAFIRMNNGTVVNGQRGTLSTGTSGNRLTPGIRGN